MKLTNRTVGLGLACACLLSICGSANAYIDAGSGSYLLQVVFAGLLAGVYVAKSAIMNVKAAIVRKVTHRRGEDPASHVS